MLHNNYNKDTHVHVIVASTVQWDLSTVVTLGPEKWLL